MPYFSFGAVVSTAVIASPTEAQLRQQAAQGGGTDAAKAESTFERRRTDARSEATRRVAQDRLRNRSTKVSRTGGKAKA